MEAEARRHARVAIHWDAHLYPVRIKSKFGKSSSRQARLYSDQRKREHSMRFCVLVVGGVSFAGTERGHPPDTRVRARGLEERRRERRAASETTTPDLKDLQEKLKRNYRHHLQRISLLSHQTAPLLLIFLLLCNHRNNYNNNSKGDQLQRQQHRKEQAQREGGAVRKGS